MNRYFLIRRLRWPAILLLAGVVALMHSTGILQHPWHWFWPLLLILLGVLMLAERALLAADGGYPMWGYDGTPVANPNAPGGVPPANGPRWTDAAGTGPAGTVQETAIVPAETHDFKNPEGGQS
jgi:hypothetical protein